MSFLTLIHQGNGSLVEGADAQLVLGPFPTPQDADTAGAQYLSRVDPQDTNNLFWTIVEIPSSQLTPDEADDIVDEDYDVPDMESSIKNALGMDFAFMTEEEAAALDAQEALEELTQASEALGLYDEDFDNDDECEHDWILLRDEDLNPTGRRICRICQQTVPHDTVLPLQTAAEVYDEMEAEAEAPIWGVFSPDDVQQGGPFTADEANDFIRAEGRKGMDYYIAKIAELSEPKKETPEWLKEQDARPEHFRSSTEFFKSFGFD